MLDDAGEAVAFAPLDDGAADWTVERALDTARSRSGRLTSVGVSPGWAVRVERHSPVEEACRIDEAEHDERVGERRLHTTAAVARGTRVGARRLRADTDCADRVDPCQ